MSSKTNYVEGRLRAVAEAVAAGHDDPRKLRELLLATTCSSTASIAKAYFAKHLQDPKLLRALIDIALEGEDAGDAPWAAANTMANFPATMLLPHKSSLEQIAREQWEYLHIPARKALAKIAAIGPA